MIDTGFNCMDCGVNTAVICEFYMVHDGLWLEANPQDDGQLCIGCLENRLGRELTPADFPDLPANDPDFELFGVRFGFSQRWLSRMGYDPDYDLEYFEALREHLRGLYQQRQEAMVQ